MQEIPTKYTVPVVVLCLALIAITVVSTVLVDVAQTKNERISEQLSTYQEIVAEKEAYLDNLLDRLNVTQADIQKYNKIYERQESKISEVSTSLERENARLREELAEAEAKCVQPYRSVPNAKAYGKAWRMELMLDRLNAIEGMTEKEDLTEEDLRLITGYLYVNSRDFRNLFIEDGVKINMNEDMQELYTANIDYLNELQNIYENFDEYPSKDLEKRLPQIATQQENIISGMQGHYFMR